MCATLCPYRIRNLSLGSTRSANFGAAIDDEQYQQQQHQLRAAAARGGSGDGETHSALIASLFSNTPPVLRFVPEGERGPPHYYYISFLLYR